MGLNAFTMAQYGLPYNPVGMGSLRDFVPGQFPLPQNPIGSGSLPKAPDMPMALIGHGNGADMPCGAGMGCCDACGMGAFDMASIQNLIPGTTFGISNTYLVAGAIVAYLLFAGSKRGRR